MATTEKLMADDADDYSFVSMAADRRPEFICDWIAILPTPLKKLQLDQDKLQTIVAFLQEK